MAAPPNYETMIAEGVAPKLAEMLAARTPPGCKTDRAYDQGRAGFTDLDRMPKSMAQGILRKRKEQYRREHGCEMPASAFWDSDLNTAVVDANDARRIARERGLKISGAFNCDYSAPVDLEQKPKLAPSIVNELVQEKIHEDPGLALKPAQELCEMVIEQHGPQEQ